MKFKVKLCTILTHCLLVTATHMVNGIKPSFLSNRYRNSNTTQKFIKQNLRKVGILPIQ